MIRLFSDKNGHCKRSFLCLVFIFALVVCTAYGKPEIDGFSYADSERSSSLSVPRDVSFDVFTNEYTGYSAVKCITSRNSVAGRFANSRVIPVYAVINSLFVLIGTIVLYHIYFYRPILTSLRSTIAYIHDMDGMKP